jgi:hypothetical protein
MSNEPLGNCPDCGQEYKDPNDVMPPPSPRDDLEVTSISWPEYAAQTHQDFECPVQREREHVDGLTAALRYFGIADLTVKVGEIMRADEHNSEYIWGNGDRWLKREQQGPGHPLNCTGCGAQLGTVRGGRFEFGSAFIELAELDGSEELSCRGCNVTLNLKETLSASGEGKQPPPALKLVTPLTAKGEGVFLKDK